MDISNQLLFFFSALGAFNGLLLGFYFLLFARPRDLTSRFLGMLILMLSIRVGKSVFFFFNPELAFIYLQFGLTACFFIGPFLYFYVKQLVQPNSRINIEWKIHLLILVPFALWFGITYPFETHQKLWRPCVLSGIYNTWIFYILLAAYTARDSFGKLIASQQKVDKLDIWVMSIIAGNMLLVSIYYSFDITYYISGALSFSFLLYLSWAYLYFNREDRILYLSQQKKSGHGGLRITEKEADKLSNSLNTLMNDEKVFKQPGLKLPDLAAKLNISPHRLSQFLNENIGKSFAQYINEYRVEEAKQMIAQNDQYTLEAIGYEVGFNSRSTFYSVFKKYQGVTPATYMKNL